MRNLAVMQRYLPTLNPWIVMVVLTALGLLGYYAVLGIRYLDASRQSDSLAGKIDQLPRVTSEGVLQNTGLKAELELQEHKVEELRSLFSYTQTTEILATLSDTAQEARIDLTSMSVGDRTSEILGGSRYSIQPLTLGITGELSRIHRFLSTLHIKLPVTAIRDINMSNLDTTPSAQIQLLLFLSPQNVPEEDDTGTDR